MLATGRTKIELVTAGDAEQISQYYLRNQEHLAPWEPDRAPNFHDIEAWLSRAQSQENSIESGTAYHFALRLDNEEAIIGLCNFTNVMRGGFLACHLGYSIDQSQQGNGLMFGALFVTIPFVFSEFGLHRVMANYIPANKRSGRLLRRLGFEREGYARDYLKIAGAWQDHILTSRINE